MKLIKAIKTARRYLKVLRRSRRPWSPKERITVVSPGGVATTMLMQHIGKFCTLNSHGDTDGLKHRPEPPVLLSDDQKLLFIYGPLDKSAASLERRGWLRIQSAKLGSVAGAYSPKAIGRTAFKHAAAKQIEKFREAERKKPKQIYCIQFDDLWEKKEELAEFLKIQDPKFVHEFPERRPRKSDVMSA